jgi:hypothetical protein
VDCNGAPTADCNRRTTADSEVAMAAHVAPALNAEDVMVRHQWGVFPSTRGGWGIALPDATVLYPLEFRGMRWPDPFTALCSADEWYKVHVEGENDAR